MTVITKQRTAPWPQGLGTAWMNVGEGLQGWLWSPGGCSGTGDNGSWKRTRRTRHGDVFLEGVQGCVQAGEASVTGAEELGKGQESSAAITQPAAPW